MANIKNKNQSPIKSEILSVSKAQYGPIPSADELLRYREVIPDLPERIVKQFEADSEHARVQQAKALDADISFDKRSQIIATFIILFGYVIACVFAYLGSDIVAFIPALGSTAMIFKGTFSRKQQTK